jgi:hypothetical protein
MLSWRSLYNRLLRRKQNSQPQQPEPVDWYLFGPPKQGLTNSGSNPTSLDRNPSHNTLACHIKSCERPSSHTVLTIAKLDVDVPYWNPNNPIKNSDLLPTYKEYMLCDRHYASEVRGKPGTKLVLSSAPIYDPDKDPTLKRKAKVN